MIRSTIALSLALAALAGPARAQELDWPHDYAAAVERAGREGKALFVLVAWPKPG